MTSNDNKTFIHIADRDSLPRKGEAIRTGVPLPRGWVADTALLSLRDAQGRPVPFQCAPLAFWADRSIKWLLVDAIVSVDAGARITLSLERGAGPTPRTQPALQITSTGGSILVNTGALEATFALGAASLLGSVRVAGQDMLDARGLFARVLDEARAS